MNITGRPSKNALFDAVEKALRPLDGFVGIDAASASFKNRKMFRTDAYYGIDIDLDALKAGLEEQEKNRYGIHADLARLDALPQNSVDVIVSTYTLYHMSPQNRLAALSHFCRITAPTGHLIFELPLTDDFDRAVTLVQEQFTCVDVLYFKNAFSRWYVSFFEREDGGVHPCLFKLPFRMIAWAIGKCEWFTRRYRSWNMHGLVFCSQKKEQGERQFFDISHVPLVQDRLYSLL